MPPTDNNESSLSYILAPPSPPARTNAPNQAPFHPDPGFSYARNGLRGRHHFFLVFALFFSFFFFFYVAAT